MKHVVVIESVSPPDGIKRTQDFSIRGTMLCIPWKKRVPCDVLNLQWSDYESWNQSSLSWLNLLKLTAIMSMCFSACVMPLLVDRHLLLFFTRKVSLKKRVLMDTTCLLLMPCLLWVYIYMNERFSAFFSLYVDLNSLMEQLDK